MSSIRGIFYFISTCAIPKAPEDSGKNLSVLYMFFNPRLIFGKIFERLFAEKSKIFITALKTVKIFQIVAQFFQEASFFFNLYANVQNFSKPFTLIERWRSSRIF